MRRIFSLVIGLLLISFLFSPSVGICGCDFDGTDDYVNCGDVTILDGASAWTISCWVNFDILALNQRIIAKWKDTGSPTLSFLISSDFTNTDELIVAHGNGAGVSDYRESTNANLSAGIWYHVLWIGNSSRANYILYINGTSVTLNAGAGTDGAIGDGSEPMFLGASNTGTTNFINGKISEIAIWNVALTAPQIALLASSRIKGMPLQIQSSSLKGYWPMDEVSDGASADLATLFDMSGNGNNGNPDNGANNTGMTGSAETVLSYPPRIQ